MYEATDGDESSQPDLQAIALIIVDEATLNGAVYTVPVEQVGDTDPFNMYLIVA